MDDLISRQAAIDHLRSIIDATDTKDRYNTGFADGLEFCISHIATMPTVQPEPAIPISWLKKEVEHLESRENSFAVLDAMQLKALIKRWRGEQNENT